MGHFQARGESGAGPRIRNPNTVGSRHHRGGSEPWLVSQGQGAPGGACKAGKLIRGLDLGRVWGIRPKGEVKRGSTRSRDSPLTHAAGRKGSGRKPSSSGQGSLASSVRRFPGVAGVGPSGRALGWRASRAGGGLVQGLLLRFMGQGSGGKSRAPSPNSRAPSQGRTADSR